MRDKIMQKRNRESFHTWLLARVFELLTDVFFVPWLFDLRLNES